MNENNKDQYRINLYNSMIDAGIDPGDVESFNQKLESRGGRDRAHSLLRAAGIQVDPFDVFERSVMGWDDNVPQSREELEQQGYQFPESKKEEPKQNLLAMNGYSPSAGVMFHYQPKKDKKEVRKAKFQNMADLNSHYEQMFDSTDEGKAARADIQAQVEKLGGYYQDQFEKSPEYQQIVAKYQDSDDAEGMLSELDAKFQEVYGKTLQDNLGGQTQNYYEKLAKAYPEYAEEMKLMQKEQIQNATPAKLDDLEKRIGTTGKMVSGVNPMFGTRGVSRYEEDPVKGYAKRLVDQTRTILDHADKNDGWFKDMVESTIENTTNGKVDYSAGVRDFFDKKEYLDILKKAERGDQLTKDEENLLEAASMNMIVTSYLQESLSSGYNAGDVTAQSIPFMLEFIANPVSGSGDAIAKGLLKYALGKWGKNVAFSAPLKVGSYVAGRTGAALGMTGTSSLPRIGSNFYERQGNNYEVNDDLSVSKVPDAEAESEIESLGKAIYSTTTENLSEMILSPIKGGSNSELLKVLNDKLNKVGLVRALRGAKKAINNNKFAKATQFSGVMEEYTEEVVNNIMNTVTGDTNWMTEPKREDYETEADFQAAMSKYKNSVLNLDNNIETFVGLIPTSLFFGVSGGVSLGVQDYNYHRKIQKLFDSLGEDGQQMADMVYRYDSVRDKVNAVLNHHGISEDDKREIISLIALEEKQNIAQEAMDDNERAESEALNNGYSATMDQYHALSNGLRDSRAALLGIERGDEILAEIDNRRASGQSVDDVISGLDAETSQKAQDYIQALNTIQGVQDKIDDEVQSKVENLVAMMPIQSDDVAGNTVMVGEDKDGKLYFVKAQSDKMTIAVDAETGETVTVPTSSLNVQTKGYDEYIAAYEDQVRRSINGIADRALRHNPRTVEPYNGLRIQNGRDMFVVQQEMDGSFSLLPTQLNKEGLPEVIPGSTPIPADVEQIMEMQDQMYDAPSNANAQDEASSTPTENVAQNAQQEVQEGAQNNTPSQPSAQQDVLAPYRDKSGDIDYDKIDNADHFAQAIASEIEDPQERDGVIDEYINMASEERQKAEKIADPMKRRRAIKKAEAKMQMYQQAKGIMTPQSAETPSTTSAPASENQNVASRPSQVETTADAPEVTAPETPQITPEQQAHNELQERGMALLQSTPKGRAILAMAEKLGLNVEFVDTFYDKNGNKVNANGAITGNTLQYNINATNPEVFIFGHEITHRIKDLSPEAFEEFKNALKTAFPKEWAEHVAEVTSRYNGNARLTLSQDDIEEEATCDMAGQMFMNRNVLQKFAKQAPQGLLQRLAQIFQDMAKFFEGTSYQERIEACEDILVNALNKAVENAGKATESTNENAETKLSLSAEEIDKQINAAIDPSHTRYSLTAIATGAGGTLTDDGNGGAAFVLDGVTYTASKPVTSAILKKQNSVLSMMMEDAAEISGLSKSKQNKIWGKYADILNSFLRKGSIENGGIEALKGAWEWMAESIYKAVATNGDAQYSYSLDITRVCKKNEAVIKAISALQKDLGYGISPAQVMDIYYMADKMGYQVPCPVCYVFSRYIRNGRYATIAINGMQKYGELLRDPANMTPAEQKQAVDMWVKLLGEQEALNEKHSKQITKAKDDIAKILGTIDEKTGKLKELGALDKLGNRLQKLQSEKASQEEIDAVMEEIEKLDQKYKAAMNVVAQASLTSWIKQFAIHQKKVGNTTQWVLYTAEEQGDLYKDGGFDPKYALDLRLTADVMRKYPAIQRLRKSGGAAAGKEITFVADNALGEVPMSLNDSNPESAPNYYKMALEADNEKDRKKYREEAKKKFLRAHLYAQQQSLRGGQRMWSWSDNIERIAPDVAINLIQMEMLGGALQSYSKQLEGIKLVASMNGYVNGSLMGRGIGYVEVDDANIEERDGKKYVKEPYTYFNKKKGKDIVMTDAGSPVYTVDGKNYALAFDDVTGIQAFDEVKDGKTYKGLLSLNQELDKAGNILVGMNDIHVRAAMADPRVYFIIPWHSSGNSVHILTQMLGYLGVDLKNFNPKDYTPVQEEKDMAGTEVRPEITQFWEDHKNEKDYKVGIKGGVESGVGQLSASQMHYRELRDAIFLGYNKEKGEMNTTGPKTTDIPEEWMKEIMADEFLSQVYKTVRDRIDSGTMTNADCKYIYPYEYWDAKSTYETADVNGERYMEYCRRLGRKPKFVGKLDSSAKEDFGNFSEDPGYWKLLIDRRMYGVDGKFQDLDPVSSDNLTSDLYDPAETEKEFLVTEVADDMGSELVAQNTKALEEQRIGGIASVDYDMSLDDAVSEYESASGKMQDFYAMAEKVQRERAKAAKNIKPAKRFSLVSKAQDNAYMDAVKAGDMETAQNMVNELARKSGYLLDDDFRMSHRAPNHEWDVNLMNTEDLVPKDYWQHPEWYTSSNMERRAHAVLARAIAKAEKNGDSSIYVYRAVPKDVNEDNMRNGDWVTPLREYAVEHGKANINGPYRIISQFTNIENLYWDANSTTELGYDNGQNYVYANTKNNRKLADAVTYDDNGDVIPLSKRFNKRNSDVRFSIAKQGHEVGLTDKQIKDMTRYAIAWHGSGADFDMFDSAFMGTGEGAQAHGYGHYVAIDKDTAKRYADSAGYNSHPVLMHNGVKVVDEILDRKYPTHIENLMNSILRKVSDGQDLGQAIGNASYQLRQLVANAKPNSTIAKKAQESLDAIDGIDFTEYEISHTEDEHYIYDVEIPDNTGSNYIEEDESFAPFATPELIADLRKELKGIKAKDFYGSDDMDDIDEFPVNKKTMEANFKYLDSFNGREAYETISYAFGPKMASEILSRNGIKGIHYDGRRDGECYVIFNDDDVKIVEKQRFSLANDDTRYSVVEIKEYAETVKTERPREEVYRNIISGLHALRQIAQGKDLVEDAMRRPDLEIHGSDGRVMFEYGKMGDPEKGFKKGYGISHIAARHGNDTLAKVLGVIATGRIERYNDGNKTIVLSDGDYEALLGLTKNGESSTWLFSGWDKIEKTGESGKVSASTTPTQGNPTFSRETLGAVISDSNLKKLFSNYNREERKSYSIAKEKADNRYSLIGINGMARVSEEKMRQYVDRAEQLEKEGADQDDIWYETGLERGADGKWRTEGPDLVLDKDAVKNAKEDTVYDIKDFVGAKEYDILTKLYPNIKDMTIGFSDMSGHGILGGYSDERNMVVLSTKERRGGRSVSVDPDYMNRILAHEVQHAIQYEEDFAVGGDWRDLDTKKTIEAGEKAREAMKNAGWDPFKRYKASKLKDEYRKVAKAEYNRLAGEVEARVVMDRFGTTEDYKRLVRPEEGLGSDVPRENQIVRFKDGTIYDMAERVQAEREEMAALEQDQTRYSIVSDKKTIEWFDKAPKIIVYKSMVKNPDGSYSAPMADELGSTSDNKKASRVKMDSLRKGQLYLADENPDMADEEGHIIINKPEGTKGNTSTRVAYNPYNHSSDTALNDQFTSAWRRPELVVVEVEITPEEWEKENPYHADKAKDPVGPNGKWKNGPVARNITGKTRTVYLTQYSRIKGEAKMSDVVKSIMDYIGKEPMPFNCVNDATREALWEAGVKIVAPTPGMGAECEAAWQEWQRTHNPSGPKGGQPRSFYEMAENVQREREEARYSLQLPRDTEGLKKYDQDHGTQISDLLDFVKLTENGTKEDKSIRYNGYFVVGDIGKSVPAYRELKKNRLQDIAGEIRIAKSVFSPEKHTLNEDHKLTKEDWLRAIERFADRTEMPNLLTALWSMDSGVYRVYLPVKHHNGQDLMLEVNTFPAQKNSITVTAFGRDAKRVADSLDAYEKARREGRNVRDREEIPLLIYENGTMKFLNGGGKKKIRGIQRTLMESDTSSSRSAEIPRIFNGKDNADSDNSNKEPRKFSLAKDSSGNSLTNGQAEYFKNSKAVDKDGNLLVLYHGTPRAGFNEFNGGWFTTSKKDADSYAGNAKGKIYDPEEKPSNERLTAGDFRVAYMTFDSQEDADEFIKQYPLASEAMTEAELRQAIDDAEWEGDDEKADELESKKKDFEQIAKAYREYESDHFVTSTYKDILDNPKAFTENDFKRALYSYDSNAILDGIEEQEDWLDRRDLYIEAINSFIEDAIDNGGATMEQMLNHPFTSRVPRNGEGVKKDFVNNRTYQCYVNVENPIEIDAKGKHSEMQSGDIYKQIYDALKDDKYDGVIVRNWRVGRHQQLGDVVVPKRSEQIKLTSNAVPTKSKDIRYSITPEQDAEYRQAYADGDTAKASKMLDDVAKKWGCLTDSKGKSKVLWHFSRTGGGFTEFNVPAWFSRNEQYAMEFFWAKPGTSKPFYIKDGASIQLKPIFGREWWKARDIANQNWALQQEDLESILGKDEGWNADDLVENKKFLRYLKKNKVAYILTKEQGYDEYIALDAKNIKSAEPFTFDDNGELIPLSERFSRKNKDFRYSLSTPAETTRVAWDRLASSSLLLYETSMFDYLAPLKKFQDLIQEKTGKRVMDYQNAYNSLICLSSRNKAEMDILDNTLVRSLINAAKAVMGDNLKFEGEKGKELDRYVKMKHGVERNRDMAVREILSQDEATYQQNLERYYQDAEAIKKQGGNWYDTQKKLNVLAEAYGADLSKDYSGISSMTDEDAWLDDIMEKVYVFEDTHKNIDDLWSAINALSQFSLNKQMSSGLTDAEYVKDQLRRYDFFVPLRGFDELTADEIYNYIDGPRKDMGTPMQTAHGRTSEAGNAFGGLMNVAYRSITSGNRNMAHQAFYNMVANMDTDGTVVINSRWAVKDSSGNFVETEPTVPFNATPDEIAAAYEQFEKDMKALEKNGDAMQVNAGKTKQPYRVLGRQFDAQHKIKVMVGGKEKVMTVVGNPMLSQAINGLLNPESGDKGTGWRKSLMRFMSGAFTSYNPSFSAANLVRDTTHANSYIFVKENGAYFREFTKRQGLMIGNVANAFRTGRLLYRYQNNKLDMNNEQERNFFNFMKYGGATGYTHVLNQKESVEQLGDMLKGLDNKSKVNPWTVYKKCVEFAGEAAELTNRFACYETSIKFGRSVTRAVMDAKEVTLNFNRKGSGTKILEGTMGDSMPTSVKAAADMTQFGRDYYMFFNANMQAKRQMLEMVSTKPRAAKTLISRIVGLGLAGGAIVPLLNEIALPMLYAMFDGGDGDDDDYKSYYDELTDYERQNNICIRLPKGMGWFKIPMNPDMSPFYAIGDVIGAHIAGARQIQAKDFIENSIDMVSPIGITWNNYKSVGASLFPTAAQPFVQVWANTNFMGNNLVKESMNRASNFDPEYTKTYKSVSPLLKDLSKAVNEWGGDEVKRGYVDETLGRLGNPAVIQNIVSGYLGGYGTSAIALSDAIYTKLLGESKYMPTSQVPLVGRFWISGSENEVYNRVERQYNSEVTDFMTKIKHDLSGYDKKLSDMTLDPMEFAKYQQKMNKLQESEEYGKYLDLEAIIDEIDGLAKMEKDDLLTEEEKAYQIKLMRDAIEYIK